MPYYLLEDGSGLYQLEDASGLYLLEDGAASITLGLLDASPALYAPSVVGGTLAVSLALLSTTPALYAPTVVGGILAVSLPLLSTAPTLYAPSVGVRQAVSLGLLDAARALYAPDLDHVATGSFAYGSIDPIHVDSYSRPLRNNNAQMVAILSDGSTDDNEIMQQSGMGMRRTTWSGHTIDNGIITTLIGWYGDRSAHTWIDCYGTNLSMRILELDIDAERFGWQRYRVTLVQA